MSVLKASLASFLIGVSLSVPAAVQTASPQRPAPRPGAITIDEATALTQGWALLAQGLVSDAAKKAAQVLAAYPRSTAALALAVEAEIARAGARAGLDQYERWLGARTLEEPTVVRRLAVAVLRETMAEGSRDAARLEALRALAADGDAAAGAELAEASASGSAPEIRALAVMGQETAVKALIAQLDGGAGNATSAIEALARSGSRLAIDPLTRRLSHASPEIRGAAVEGLGTLGVRFDAIELLKPLLQDKSGYVRIRAAAALFRLGDTSGAALLQELWTAEAASSRLIAAQAMASKPDAVWMDQVRGLTAAQEPEIRVGAARLIAPYDPQLARQVIDRGLADANPAVRELAAESISEIYATDLRALRHLLRLPDRLARARSAARVLALLR